MNKTPNEIAEEYKIIKQSVKDIDCFEKIYNLYYTDIFRFVYKRLNDKDITADICSQIFLKAMLNLPKFKFKGLPFSAWLFRVAINEINLWFRKQKKENQIYISKETAKSFSKLFYTADESDFDENYKKITDALQKITVEEYKIIELRFFDDKSFREIGFILNITENNAKVKLYRILDKIKIHILNPRKSTKNNNITVIIF